MELQETEIQDDRRHSSRVEESARSRQGEPDVSEAWQDVYARLEQAAPEKKAEIVLQLIEEHPQGRLELPQRNGTRANLSQVDLSGDTITWRDDLRVNLKQANLREARLPGAKLRNADLAGAELTYADLSGANLQNADLADADLRKADLRYADLRNADLADANLQSASLFGADLRNAGFRSANLRYASLRHTDLRTADLKHADLRNADLRHADLRNADLAGTHLRNAGLRSAKLQGADLERANLQNAGLRHADLRTAILKGANLQRTDLEHANLRGAHLTGAWLDRTRLRRGNFGEETGREAIGEEIEAENKELPARERARRYREAKHTYIVLKQNFDSLGHYTGSSWAYRKERRMEKLEAREKTKAAFAAHNWRGVVSNGSKFLSDVLVEIVCDYGEGIWRVLFWICAFIFIIGPLLFGVLGVFDRAAWSKDVYASLSNSGQKNVNGYYQFLLYSIDTFSTANFAELTPNSALARLASGCLAMIGVFLVGLLGFVAGRRIRRS